MLPDRGLLPPPFVGLQILNAELTEIRLDSLSAKADAPRTIWRCLSG